MFTAIGDSNTVGVGASPSSNSWMARFAPINTAVSGSQAAEVSNKALTLTPAVGANYTVMVGTNDVRHYKNDATKQSYYERFLRSAICWLSFPSKVIARNMSETGTWTNTGANNIGRVSTQIGATIEAVVSGTKVFVGYIIQNNSAALSTADVYIDNVLVGAISCDGQTVSMNTVNGATYATACEVFTVGAGSHDVRIEVTSSGKNMYVDYVAGNDQPTANVFVSNIPKYSAAGYTYYGVTESTTDAFNAIVDSVIADCAACLVDNHAAVDPTIHLADYVHLNNAGHAVVHDNFNAYL